MGTGFPALSRGGLERSKGFKDAKGPWFDAKFYYPCATSLLEAALTQIESGDCFEYDLTYRLGKGPHNAQKTPHPDTKGAVTTAVVRFVGLWLCLAFFLPSVVIGGDRAWGDEIDQSTAPELTLVELFTSQGCSSCPPADAFLRDLAKRQDVLALSFHVDYWNSDDWRDPFSSPSFSVRQRRYQDAFATDFVYTPQVIVNGAFAAPGGQRSAILNAIDDRNTDNSIRPPLVLNLTDDGHIRIVVSQSDHHVSGSLYAAVFNLSEITRVRGGENRGRTLTNINIVRRLIKFAPYQGQDAAFLFSLNDLDATPTDGIAVFIQTDGHGPILATAAVAPVSKPPGRVSLNNMAVSPAIQ